MTQDEHATSDSPDPDPAVTAGLGSGGSTAPGDTPPASDSMSESTGGGTYSDGPVSGNRTPMFIALGAVGLIVVMVALLVGASLIPS